MQVNIVATMNVKTKELALEQVSSFIEFLENSSGMLESFNAQIYEEIKNGRAFLL